MLGEKSLSYSDQFHDFVLSGDKLLRQCPKFPEIILTEKLLTPPLPRGLLPQLPLLRRGNGDDSSVCQDKHHCRGVAET